MYGYVHRRADVVKFGGGIGRHLGKLKSAWELKRRLEAVKVNGFIDIGSVLNVGIGVIVLGVIFLILAYITPVINQNLPSNSTWAAAWTSISGYAKTSFMFIGLGFIVGGAVYILRLVIGGFRNMF